MNNHVPQGCIRGCARYSYDGEPLQVISGVADVRDCLAYRFDDRVKEHVTWLYDLQLVLV